MRVAGVEAGLACSFALSSDIDRWGEAMSDRLLLGIGRRMIPIPRIVWQRLIKANARKTEARLGFMSADHHRVRDFVVTELARQGAPLAPGLIAEKLGLAADRVSVILDELEKHLTFLVRNAEGAVTWAFPVTADETPHQAAFTTGEEAYSP
jgi:hypothetical protein